MSSEYGFHVIGYALLICSISMPWSLFLLNYLDIASTNPVYTSVPMDLGWPMLSVLISYVYLAPKLAPPQIMVLAVLHPLAYVANHVSIKEATVPMQIDQGGGLEIHLFGSCFGLMAALVMRAAPSYHSKATNNSDYSIFDPIIAALIMWGYLDFYISAYYLFLGGAAGTSNYAVSICSGVNAAFLISRFMSRGQFSMKDITKSIVASGIAISTLVTAPVNLGYVATVGTLAAALAIITRKHLTPRLEGIIGVQDWTLIPGFISGIFAMIGIAIVTTGESSTTAGYYGTAMCISIALGIGGGIVTGFILNVVGAQTEFEEYIKLWKEE